MVGRQPPASGLSRKTADGWSIGAKQLKRYPHFDRELSPDEAFDLATEPDAVKRHAFFPFLVFTKHFTRFAKRGKAGKPKDRRIRFAARADAYIMARYRHLLAGHYERELAGAGLGDAVLAYRRLRDPATGKGKSNIHHARDAFNKIKEMGACCAIALDIRSFFESLDHKMLKARWAALLGVDRLPDDHHAVFTALTSYREVERTEALVRLGHMTVAKDTHGNDRVRYATDADGRAIRVPVQVCSPADFRKKIAGDGTGRGIIKPNRKHYGIPQGSPISDLLANLYLLPFDKAMNDALREVGGVYLRYSDDILILVPGDEHEARRWHDYAAALLPQFGGALEIATNKSQIVRFEPDAGGQRFRQIAGERTLHGLEYLGFRYDGRGIYIRNSTLSNLRRKVAEQASAAAWRCAKRYPDKGVISLLPLLEVNSLVQRFGRVLDFEKFASTPTKWTFWTYARRAAEVFGKDGHLIRRQMRHHVRHVEHRARAELERVVARRSNAKL